jgi:hypothetical protein
MLRKGLADGQIRIRNKIPSAGVLRSPELVAPQLYKENTQLLVQRDNSLSGKPPGRQEQRSSAPGRFITNYLEFNRNGRLLMIDIRLKFTPELSCTRLR